MTHSTTVSTIKYRVDLSVLTLLFFMWGFVTCLNDILIPHFKEAFDLSYFQASLIQFTFFIAYFLLAIPSGIITTKFGYRRTLVAGLVIASCGAFGFILAANLMSYFAFLCSLFVLACGITFLQVSANPFVTVIGPDTSASSRLNLTQAFNALGTTLAPIFGSLFILGGSAGVGAVVAPYLFLGLLLCALSLLFVYYPLPNVANEDRDIDARWSDIWSRRHTIYGAIAIFVYVGAEVAIGSFLVNYIGSPEVMSLSHENAAHYVAFYWGGAMVGRFIGSALLRRVGTGTLLSLCAALAILLILISISSGGATAMYTMLAVGLCNSIMFPSIFTLGIAKLGRLTGIGSSLLVMAIVGGAIVPMLVGVLADTRGLQQALFVPVLCYLYIVYYGIFGSRPSVGDA